MAPRWIVPGKLKAPTRPAGWLPRAFWPADEAPPAAFLLGGPGYGKTLGLLAIAEDAAAAGALVLWYSLDPDDAEPASFFHYLVAGLQAHIPQFGEDVLALLQGENPEPRQLWGRFFGELARFNSPRCLIALDDLHHLGESSVLTGLAYWLERLPEGVHLAAASRQRLPFPIGRLQAKGHMRLIDQPRLRFTPDEALAFLRLRAADPAVPAAWHDRAARMEGWPLGLDLATRVDGFSADAALTLTSYVAEELVLSQPEPRRRFMLQAALLQELTPEACRWTFQALDAAEHLAALDAEHLLFRLEQGAGYRFPAYLRDYLRDEAEREFPAIARAEWHRRAAAYYIDQGADALALPHALAGRDWPGAIAACEASFPLMRFDGRERLIRTWLDAFPEPVRHDEPMLALWEGHMLARAGRHAEAQPHYEQARRGYADRLDDAGAFKAIVCLANSALILEDTRRFHQLTMQALALEADGRDEDRVDLCLIRARAAESRGDLKLAAECLEAVLAIPVGRNVEIAASHCITEINRFTVALHAGALATAHLAIDRAIALAEAWGFRPYGLLAGFLRAHLDLLQGELERAATFFRALPPHWHALLDWLDQGLSFTILGHWHQAREEWKEAEDALRKATGVFERAGYAEGLKVPLERQLWLAIQRRQIARVPGLLEGVAIAGHSVHDLALAVPQARALHLGGDPAGALTTLESAIPALEDLGAQLHLTRARLFEAAARHRLGDPAGARASLERAERLIDQQAFEFLRGQDRGLWEELAPLRERSRVDLPSSPSPVELKAVVPAAPGPSTAPLALSALGTFEVRLDGVLLDHWPRRKAKLMLAGLVVYPRGLTVEDMADLWGEAEANATTVKVSMSALRKTFEPSLGKGEGSRYVLFEENRYRLNPEAVGRLDLSAFEAALAEGHACKETEALAAARHLESAIALYRGGLFADDFFVKYFEAERESYRKRALEAFFWLADHYGRLGLHADSERVLTRAIAIAPCEEEAYLALMRLHHGLGRADRVRQAYWDCRQAFKSHLGMSPGEELETGYRGLLAEA